MIFHSTSKKPVVIVGNGVRSAGAVELLHEFYKKTKIPVLTTMNAVDLMQEDDKLGFIGVYGNRIANMIVANSDFVISIGARLGLRQIGNKRDFFAPNAFLVRADVDQNELSRNIKENEEKHLIDAKEFLKNILNEDIPVYSKWNKRCFDAKKILDPFDKDLGNLCIEKISSLLDDNPVVAVDVGQNQCWAAQSLLIKGSAGRILIGGGYGSMGCGLPYAIGASLALDGKKVYCITGDGGLQMNIQELQTVSSEALPIKIFVINNMALGKISEIQAGSYNKHFCITTNDSGYKVPDFVKIASAYGISAKKHYGFDSLEDSMDLLNDDKPCLIDIILPSDTMLLPKMNWNEKEMKPLLDEDIMKKTESLLG